MKKLLEIDRRLAELKALRQKVASQEALSARRQRTQRCVILGAWLLSNDPSKVAQIVGQLTRSQDRRVFGMHDEVAITNIAQGSFVTETSNSSASE